MTTDRVTLIDETFQWLHDHQRHFVRGQGINRLKRLAELAIAMDFVLRHSKDRAMRSGARDLLAVAWSALAQGDAIIPHVESMKGGAVLATTCFGFHSRGLTNPRLGRVLVRETRRYPWRDPALSLYLAAAMQRFGLSCAHQPEEFTAACSASVEAASRPLTVKAGYVLTHVVFFLSDFGRNPRKIESGRWDWISARMAGWLRQLRREGQSDLYAELVLVAHCLSLPCPSPSPWPWLSRIHRTLVRESIGFGRVYHRVQTALLASVSCHCDFPGSWRG